VLAGRVLPLTVAGQSFAMSRFVIASSQGDYQVRLSEGLNDLIESNSIFIVDRVVSKSEFVLRINPERLILVDGSENTKTVAFCCELLEELANRGVDKSSSLVAVGGGSVQDLVTLCASIYMRGIPWTYVPTTFMAMADSCIGGKSAINVGNYKNLVGNFYPPESIRIEEKFLETLGSVGIACGLCEAVKIQIARGPIEFVSFDDLYSQYQSHPSPSALIEIARLSLVVKKWFIEIDEFDKKERKLLNYGHTFGHALESASHMGIPHGLAVGVGMLVANSLVTSTGYVEQINNLTKNILLQSGFDFSSLHVKADSFIKSLKLDKKNFGDNQVLVLLNTEGRLALDVQPMRDENLLEQADALMKVLSSLKGS
jgi:3-dehydroquinate synthase